MKKTLQSALSVAAFIKCASIACAASSIITSVTTDAVWSTSSSNTGNHVLESFTIGSGTYSNITFSDAVTTALGSSTGNIVFGDGASEPTILGAMTDNLIDTGMISQGSGDVFTWSSATVAATDEIFIIFNGSSGFTDPPTAITATDASGATIGSAISLTAMTDTDHFGTYDARRGDPNNGLLSGRRLFGITITASDLGVTASDIKGIQITAPNAMDTNMVGFASVPEPGTYALLVGFAALGFVASRRGK